MSPLRLTVALALPPAAPLVFSLGPPPPPTAQYQEKSEAAPFRERTMLEVAEPAVPGLPPCCRHCFRRRCFLPTRSYPVVENERALMSDSLAPLPPLPVPLPCPPLPPSQLHIGRNASARIVVGTDCTQRGAATISAGGIGTLPVAALAAEGPCGGVARSITAAVRGGVGGCGRGGGARHYRPHSRARGAEFYASAGPAIAPVSPGCRCEGSSDVVDHISELLGGGQGAVPARAAVATGTHGIWWTGRARARRSLRCRRWPWPHHLDRWRKR